MLLRWLGHDRKDRRGKPSRQRTRRVGGTTLLRGEQLEDRCVPATFTWKAEEDGKASVPTNWNPNGVPGQFDKIVFDGVKDTNCTMDITKVQDFEIAAGYTGRITINNAPQIGASTLEVTNTFKMMAKDATISAWAGVSTLHLSGASIFTWSAGTMSGIDIRLGSATNHAVTGKIDGTVAMDTAHLINYGTFTWVQGWIHIVNATSEIVNETGGTFEVQAEAGLTTTLQGGGGTFTNRGLLKFNTNLVSIEADFRNDGGTVRVYPGTVMFDYKAEQTSGTFELRGGTAKPAGQGQGQVQVLRIYNGSIVGDGTVDGNLTLGTDGQAQAGAPVISPGISDGNNKTADVGTLTITQSFHIFASNAGTIIEVSPVGAYDKIAVTGYAALAGNFAGTFYSSDPMDPTKIYKEAAGTTLTFLSAGQTFLNTDFAQKNFTQSGIVWAHPANPGKQHHWQLKKDNEQNPSAYIFKVEFHPVQPPPG